MSNKETGGPAFPCEGMDNGPGNFKGRPSDGMTLRDYFAAKALVGAFNSRGFTDELTFEEKAQWVYQMADAMLEARK